MEWQDVVSRSVSRVGYSSSRRVLGVEFVRGGCYEYLEVPEAEYAALLRAESKGVYLNQFIKGYYGHQAGSGVTP